jgi:hypothetical protein
MASFSTARTIPELQDYASRLHAVDPKCTEPIPVTPDEAYAFTDSWLRSQRMTDRNCFRTEEMNILGHRFKIL